MMLSTSHLRHPKTAGQSIGRLVVQAQACDLAISAPRIEAKS